MEINNINRAILERLLKGKEGFPEFTERAGLNRGGFYKAMANDSHNWSMYGLAKVCKALNVAPWKLLKESDRISNHILDGRRWVPSN
jgi:DNA-binding phage protein